MSNSADSVYVLAFCLQVRFFGKFFGTHADYYVFETTLKSPPEEPEQQLGE
jgi:hypothetical protein